MKNPDKHQKQIEINDLIAEAVSNASARREQISELSDEEADEISGGLAVFFRPPIILGIIRPPEMLL